MKIRLTENTLRNIIRESVQQVIKEDYADTRMGANPFLGQGDRDSYGIGNGFSSNSDLIPGDGEIETIGDFVWALQNWFLPYATGSRKTTIQKAINMFSEMNQNHRVKYYSAIQEGRIGNFFSGLGKKAGNALRNLFDVQTTEDDYNRVKAISDRFDTIRQNKMTSRCKKMQRFIKSMFYRYQELGQGRNKYYGILRQLYNVIGSMRDINTYKIRDNFDNEWSNSGSADARRYRDLSQSYNDRSKRGWNTRRTNQTLKSRKARKHAI